MNCIIMFGMPCSGKSTIGKELAKELGYDYVSSGDIAREMAKSDNNVNNDLNNGKLAPEDAMRSAIYDKIMESNNLVLDGFPRFGDQLVWLYQNFVGINFIAIHIMIDSDTAIKRSVARGRDDDQSIIKRILNYYENTYQMAINADVTVENIGDKNSNHGLVKSILEVLK